MNAQLFSHAHIFTPRDEGKPAAGSAQGELVHYPSGALLVQDGNILAIGDETEVRRQADSCSNLQETDCGGRCMVPGLVDPHTHLCFAESREAEFSLRLAGSSYLEILHQGGGILSSVRSLAAMDEETLYRKSAQRLINTLCHGTTSIEIKSGYGLSTTEELKMLRVIDRLNRETPSDVVATFLGAHAVPEEFVGRTDSYLDLVISEMLPAVKNQGIAKFCDVFCEDGVFSVEQSRKLLLAAKAQGFQLKLHADEVNDLGGAALAAELGATSADHLLAAGRENLKAMAAAGVIAVLLPATAFSLRKPFAPGRQMVEDGLAVALATDCNPGSSFCESLPFAMALAVLQMGLTPEQALVGATLNAAYAIGMAERVGSLEPGKQADFLLLDGESPAIFAYHLGVNVVSEVYKRGRLFMPGVER